MLTTYQLQGSCSTFLSVPSSGSRGSKVDLLLPTFNPRRKGISISKNSLRCRPSSSVGSSLALGPKKSFKISAFKGNSRHDDSAGRANGSKSSKNPVQISFLQHASEESSVESSNVQNFVSAPYTAEDLKETRSLAIQNLFKKWLMLLRIPPQTQAVAEALEEASPVEETSEVHNRTQNSRQMDVLKAASCYFWGLDATLKIPLLIFAPLYLGVNIVCGSKVSKELSPLWILGPPIMALYVKMFHAICSLYIFSFTQAAKVVKNLPSYALLSHEYIFRGKLKEAMGTYIWQPLVDIKKVDYKHAARRKINSLQGMLFERYLDFIELIWPYYNRIVRSLKRANLI